MIGRWIGAPLAALCVLLAAATITTVGTAHRVSAADASAQAAPEATTTTLPVDLGNRSVIPLPGSGRAPTSSGDPGGSGQLLLFGIMAVGCAIIFGRVLWAAHQRSRANARQVDLK